MLTIGNGCCNGYNNIVAILDKSLFFQQLNGVLCERYKQMINLCNDPQNVWVNAKTYLGCSIVNQKDVLLKVGISNNPSLGHLQNYDNLGHDLPYWVETGNGPRIMLVSQDPLRNNQKSGFITLSSPFGIHSDDYRNSGNKLITRIVENHIKKNGSVYLTDFNKLYATDKQAKVKWSVDFKAILSEEINFFRPDKIIAVGKLAANSLSNMGVNPIPIPHPNAPINAIQLQDLSVLYSFSLDSNDFIATLSLRKKHSHSPFR